MKKIFIILEIFFLEKSLLFSSQEFISRRIRNPIVFPAWMEKAGIVSEFKTNLDKKKIPPENLHIVKEYKILEKLEKYWKAKYPSGSKVFNRVEELVNVLIHWTNTIIKEKETLQNYGLESTSIKKFIDLGIGGWADVGIIADLYPETEIVGVEKFSYPYDKALETLKILGLPESIKAVQADMTALEGIKETNGPVERFRIKHPGKMIGVYLIGFGENTVIGLKWMQELFGGILKRLSEKGILTITMEETRAFDQRIQEAAFLLSGFKIRRVPPQPYQGPHDTYGLPLLGLFPWVSIDYEYTAHKSAIENLLKIYKNAQAIEEEFSPRVMSKLFMLVILPGNTDLANFIGLRALANAGFQNRLKEIIWNAFDKFGFDKESAWEEIKKTLAEELK
ncbi:MAG: hypothetical protein NC920_00530 [Candidatus Omnitrophica bacterium]|nr:hypothetical protein [Candidatus Omnitrophota bacterium]MCM8798047.1 hypothetical protein [Candidatus Omnitrophota bacterium]